VEDSGISDMRENDNKKPAGGADRPASEEERVKLLLVFYGKQL
jgi:hypothetical protein